MCYLFKQVVHDRDFFVILQCLLGSEDGNGCTLGQLLLGLAAASQTVQVIQIFVWPPT
jgi:hypothetical protein